jgi:hypothetical protein
MGTELNAINLFELGSLVQLSIGTWSGRKMLTREDMRRMGLNADELPEELVNLGRKLLVSKEELAKFSQITQRARGYLGNWSIPFGIGSAQFVPTEVLPDVMARLEGFEKEFHELVDSFIDRYGELREAIRQQHADFFERCLRRHYPSSPDALRHKFYFRFFTFRIAGADGFNPVSFAEAKLQATTLKEKETLMKKQMRAEVDKFVEQTVGILRAETVRFCDLVTARVNNTPYGDEEQPKKFMPRSLTCFQAYVDRFRKLNIFGDEKIEQMLVDLKTTYLDNTTIAELQAPSMAKAVTDLCAKIRETAANENGEMSEFLNLAKRRIVL